MAQLREKLLRLVFVVFLILFILLALLALLDYASYQHNIEQYEKNLTPRDKENIEKYYPGPKWEPKPTMEVAVCALRW